MEKNVLSSYFIWIFTVYLSTCLQVSRMKGITKYHSPLLLMLASWIVQALTSFWSIQPLKHQKCKCIKVNVLQFSNTSCLPKQSTQTGQTKIRLLLKKRSDQGLPCFLFCQAFCEFSLENSHFIREQKEKFENFRTFTILEYIICVCETLYYNHMLVHTAGAFPKTRAITPVLRKI